MTFIQSSQHASVFRRLFVVWVLLCAAISGVVVLVVLYNDTVRISRETENLRETFSILQNQNAELQGALLAVFDPLQIHDAVVARGLVAEKNPSYITINHPWVFASRY